MDYPKLANCSSSDIEKACKKLGGFIISKAGKHAIKITYTANQKANVIPNTNLLKRGLVWDFVRAFLQRECKFSEKQIFNVLWC